MRSLIGVFLFVFILNSCSNDTSKTQEKTFDINLRIHADPGQINAFYSPTSIGREVFQYMFTPLADFHPDDLKLTPILIEAIPVGEKEIINGNEYVTFEITFLEEAQWPDGKSLSAKDYLFTITMIKHPDSKITAWKPYFEYMKRIELDKDNDRRFKVYMDPTYMLSLETALTTNIMPHHKYDKDGVLINNSEQIFDSNYVASDSSEVAIVEEVNKTFNHKKEIFQVGPYELTDFQSEEYIILEKKKDYWGDAFPNNPFLQAYADRMVFKVVPDEVAAINMAKEGKLDLVNVRSSETFLKLRDDSTVNTDWTFHTPQITRTYYLSLNNKGKVLKDKRVRRALTHLVDVDDIIENLDGGLAIRTTGPFHQSKSYYNSDLQPISYNVEMAKEILSAAGWEDTDDDGVRDKVIEGAKVDLTLEYLYTGSELAKGIGLLLKGTAKEAGMDIEMVSKKMSLIRKDNLSQFNYDMFASAITTDANPDDPYSRFHSDNAVPGTSNIMGYANKKADVLIEKIRTTLDVKERHKAYLDLQEIFYEDQPCVFLYNPLSKIMINKNFTAKTTSKRPGYLANTFKWRN